MSERDVHTTDRDLRHLMELLAGQSLRRFEPWVIREAALAVSRDASQVGGAE